MNENEQKPKRTNEEFLRDNVKYMGFGEGLYDQLSIQLKTGAPSFSLPISLEHDGKKTDYQLNFGKGKNGDMYFFNNYEATLAEKGTAQTFYVDKGKGITAKEAFNLLEGRSVKKEMHTKDGVAYKAWAKLDLNGPNENGQHKINTYGERYGYDLEAVLSKFIIREMDNPERADWLIKNLEPGNLENVMMVRGEKRVNDPNDATTKERPTFIEAAPQFKTINIFDENHKKLFVVNDNPVKIDKAVANQANAENQKTPEGQQVKQEAKTKKAPKITNVGPQKRGGVSM